MTYISFQVTRYLRGWGQLSRVGTGRPVRFSNHGPKPGPAREIRHRPVRLQSHGTSARSGPTREILRSRASARPSP